MSTTVDRFDVQRQRARHLITRWRLNRLRIWQFVWAPFWLWTEIPPPPASRRGVTAGHTDETGQQLLSGIDHICQQLRAQWLMTIIVRTAWISLLATALVVVLQRIALVRPGSIAPLAGAAVVGIAGLIFAHLARPYYPQVARMIDRTFDLQERMTTALECISAAPRSVTTSRIVSLLVGEAAVLASHIARSPLLQPRLPWREFGLLAASALLLLSLVLLEPLGHVPAKEPVPWLPEASAASPADDPAHTQATMALEGANDQARRSAEAQQALDELARALRDHGLTRETAEAIERGDYQGAAESLRQLSEQVGESSSAARRELARDLARTSRSLPEPLSGASAQAASGLRGEDGAAADGLRQLADAVKSTGSQVTPPQNRSGQAEPSGQRPTQNGTNGAPQPGVGADEQGPPGQGNDPMQGTAESGQSADAGAGPDESAQDGSDSSSAQGGGAGQDSLVPAQERTADAPAPAPQGGEGLSLPTDDSDGTPGNVALDSGSPGSGSGSAYTGGGEVTQQPVGTAGPDSNRVPDDLRSVVERYFTPDAPQ